jgi:DNA-formamidopyrimidine glycosylase
MPEGNTILRIARAHDRDLAGRRVRVSAAQKTFAKEAKLLDGRVFERAEARGKHLFHHWRGGPIVHLHLGRFGDFSRREAPPPPPRPSVRMRLSTSEVTWDLIGPPTCEIVTPEERDAILARLGPDPLSSRPDAERVFARLRRTDVPIAHALLDQRVLAGVGNIFRAEALFVDGIHPLRPASSLTPAELARLWATVRRMMRRAVRRERTTTLEPADSPRGRRRSGARSFYVYQEDVCLRCGGRIRNFPLSGRTMYACETCQPRPSTRRSNAKRTRHAQSQLSG